MSKRNWLIAGGVVLVAALVAAVSRGRGSQAQHFTAAIEKGEIRDVVEATGTVNAVITVQVGSQVSGTIARLNADFNSRVHKGEVIALIDSSLFHGVLLQAQADLESAEANRSAAEANVEKANATMVQTKAEYDRTTRLAGEKMMSQQDLDIAKSNYDAACASVDAAIANVAQAKAQVSQKSAAVSIARTNLAYTVIRSPIDGVVVARNVDVGQTVAASLQAPTVFTIAQDLTKMQVYVKVDESDVGSIKAGRPVSFKVDAFPKETFQGVVNQVRMNPTTIQNVVTYDAIIDFGNPELKLFPGMTAYVTIPVASVEAALKVPNAALRYKPPLSPEEVRALYAKFGIQGSDGSASKHQDGKSPARESPSETAVVWKLHSDRSLEPVKITLGITDHAFTEVKAIERGELKEGEPVVIRSTVANNQGPQGIRR
jgi:HlyD family secretion protein